MRTRFVVSLHWCLSLQCLLSLLAMGWGCSPTLRDRVYACSETEGCPTGFSCVSGLCRRGTGTECRQDVQCDDGSLCTADVCDSGYCTHEADPTANGVECFDDSFCNGTDVCDDGVCVNVGPTPCASCDETAGCIDCGTLGSECCSGTCIDAACVENTCVTCGGLEEVCCIGQCQSPDLTCVASEDRCRPCGGDGQPCCASDAPCASPTSSCDGLVEPPTCAACGGDGQPCCQEGCRVGACDLDGVCRVTVCERPCEESTVCVPAEVGPPRCAPCGSRGFSCCPGATTCSDGAPCDYGRCPDVGTD